MQNQYEPIDLCHSIASKPISINYPSPTDWSLWTNQFPMVLEVHSAWLLGGSDGVSSLQMPDKQLVSSFPVTLWSQDQVLKALFPNS